MIIRKTNYYKDEVELFPGEEICPSCNGEGVFDKIDPINNYTYSICCFLCEGEGKIDWIQKVMGKFK